jgi:hypothetical protein
MTSVQENVETTEQFIQRLETSFRNYSSPQKTIVTVIEHAA